MLFFRSAIRSISTEPINFAFDKNLSNIKNKGKFLIAATGVVLNNCSSRPQQEATTLVQQCQQQFHQQQYQQRRNFSNLQNKNLAAMNHSQQINRKICTQEITKNLTLFSNKPRPVDKDPKSLRLKEPTDAPLVLIFGWLLAKRKNLIKYIKLYTDLGFDALAVNVTPWQILWPVKGSQIVAETILRFLENNPNYDPMVVHGFSVGGYVFGEVMVHMARDIERYQPILDRFVAQVWDSAADLTEINVGVPKAVFPRNPNLQKVLRNYMEYHMKTFHQQATVHYIRSSQMFHFTLIKAPALFFLSKDDPIGTEKSNLAAKENQERAGIKVTWKCWDHSSHVSHLQKHPEEYKAYLLKHLQENAMERIAQKCSIKVSSMILKEPIESPLVVIFSWMLAKKSHLAKYVKFYIDLGFDVLTVEITPWQLLWPMKGTQPTAASALKFLENNALYKPLVVHGFSVGGYVFGEVMVQMAKDLERYQPIIDRFVAQIWDSAADITEIPVGFPKAMFPKNPTLEKALRSYMIYHLKTFHENATVHYMRSSQLFHSTLIKVPALFLLSKTDPIGAENSNRSVKEDYDNAGIKTTWKCWDNSPHVLHYQKHPDEYRQYLLKHLQENVMDKIPERLRAKL